MTKRGPALINATPTPPGLIEQFYKLHPKLQAIYFHAAALLWFYFGKRFLITSVYRGDDPGSVHGYYRGLDVDVADFDPRKQYEGCVLPMEAEIICSEINDIYRYNPNDNLFVAVYGWRDKKGSHYNHIHFQGRKETERNSSHAAAN